MKNKDVVRFYPGQEIVPFFKNSDICRYCTNENNHYYILYLGRENTKLKIESTIYNHLFKFKNILDSRREVKNNVIKFFQLQWSRNESIFKAPKIVAPQRSRVNTFGYNEIDWYAASDVFFITNTNSKYNLKYILALLNSRLYYFWLLHKGKKKGNALELTATPLKEIPIVYVNTDIQNEIIFIVDSILSCIENHTNITELENILNKKIYNIFNITPDEQKIVEQSLK